MTDAEDSSETPRVGIIRRIVRACVQPFGFVWRIRPSASAKSWYLWALVLSIAHGAMIIGFFAVADHLAAPMRERIVLWWPVAVAFITWVQVKSVGERPPGANAEAWDKGDNNTSYVPMAAIFIVFAIFATVWVTTHMGWSKPWFGFSFGGIYDDFLPHTWRQTYRALLVSFFGALCDIALISVQYKISRGLSRVSPA